MHQTKLNGRGSVNDGTLPTFDGYVNVAQLDFNQRLDDHFLLHIDSNVTTGK